MGCSPQAPLSVGFFRHESWSGLPFPPPGDHPNPRIEPESLALPALAGGLFTHWATWEVRVLPLNQCNSSSSSLISLGIAKIEKTQENTQCKQIMARWGSRVPSTRFQQMPGPESMVFLLKQLTRHLSSYGLRWHGRDWTFFQWLTSFLTQLLIYLINIYWAGMCWALCLINY